MASKLVFAADTAQFIVPVQKSATEIRALKSEIQSLQKAAQQSFRDQVLQAKAAGASTEELRQIEQSYFREKIALQNSARQIDREAISGSKEQVSAEEAKRRAIERTTEVLKTQRAEVEKLLPLQEKHYTPSRQQQASAILRGGGLRAGEAFASTIPGFGQFAEIAFPIAGAAALASEFIRGYEALAKLNKEAHEVADNIKSGFGELVAPIRMSTDELLKTNAELDISIAKLEHKPVNGLALAMAEARIEADKLAESANRAFEDVKKLLEANQNGFYGQVFLGKADTGLVSEKVTRQMQSLRNLNGDYNNAVHSGASQQQLNDLKAKIASTEQDLLNFANSEIQTRTGTELTGDVNEKTGLITNQRSVKYSDLHGSQDENLNILNGIRNFIYAQRDYRSAAADNQEKSVKEKGLQSQKQMSADAIAAQKKADEQQRKLWDDDLAELESNGSTTKAAIEQFWVDRENETVAGSENYLYAGKKANEALKALNVERERIFDEGLKMQREFSAIGLAGLQGGAIASTRTADARGIAEAASSGARLRDQQEDAARSIALATIQWQLQAGMISKADAAVQTQTIHTMQYEAAVERLRAQYEALMDGPEKAAQQNNLNAQLTELNSKRAVEVMQDQAAVLGQSWEDALKKANANFVQDSQDTAKQVKDLYSSAIDGVNGDLAGFITNVGRKGYYRPGKQLENAVGGTVRGIGGSIAKTGFERAESSVLGAFGLGGKADGSKSNPFYVMLAGTGGFGAGSPFTFGGNAPLSAGFSAIMNLRAPAGSDDVNDVMGSMGSGSMAGLASLFGGARAMGGGVAAGKTFLVGENGPELFTPGATGYITPNNRLSALGGASHTFNIPIDARGTSNPAEVEAAANRAVMAAAPHIVAASLQAHRNINNSMPTTKRL